MRAPAIVIQRPLRAALFALASSLSLSLWLPLAALAQASADHAGHAMPAASATPGVAAPAMDHSKMDHSKMDHSTMGSSTKDSAKPPAAGPSMDMGAMMKSMQGGTPPPDARDPDAYADGLTHGPMPGMDMADNDAYTHVLLNQFELFKGRDGSGQALDAQAWFGTDRNKLWLKASGERSGGRLGATRLEGLWNHAIAAYWGLQTGIRHDVGDGPSRTWAAFGVQGLAPYWFEVEATAYAGPRGRTALRLEAEYELLLTQRLILQPDVEVNLYGKNDPERGIGRGVSDIDVGLRLRYEITRKFAPYVGVVYSRKFGNTASYARAAGERVSDTQVVAGIRIWF